MPENVLICGANWLGDSVMSMPAIQRFKEKFPSCRLTILVKPKLSGLWTMHSCMDGAIELQDGAFGVFRTAALVRQCGFDEAFIFPNSFRSALIPFLAGVPVRRGVAGHQRGWMLTDVVHLMEDEARRHQAWEYLAIMDVAGKCTEPGTPRLTISPEMSAGAAKLFGRTSQKGWIGLLPGAAYGPAKRWPVEYFVEVGKSLSVVDNYDIAVLGAASEAELCSAVASGIGAKAVNLAGKTSLSDLAALLGICRAVVTNDSGGMHLASATGTRVVSVFGITDHSKTGPLGKNSRVVFEEGVRRSRDIERVSAEAEASLRSIRPERVCSVLRELLAGGTA